MWTRHITALIVAQCPLLLGHLKEGFMILCESMNFHPDKQLFQVAGPWVRTTDPWITMAALSPYTMGDSCILLYAV